ncbi:MAG: bifunctional phosphopantothenoylcysteine decarboxylase/phosphopantothenate--cysteine ligase CoaBC [Acidobacteriota bacterium]|jgi:phosphopantothenoylcysteine decarboxylase/phosphopantothenate--cysteine ligase|nr:MAG: bifunctional phosphopantothenoylcysteine decarboxylase/phosphopantothenate--cysteine ligase CoaBC [Acidobacteriota bacterium]
MAFIALGVSGGIGAYKAVELTRLLQKRGHRVQVVMTRAARRFVGPLTFEAITREPVVTSQFAPGQNADIEHIALASSIDALVVAPATANIIGRFAAGLADDFLTSLYLATRAPVVLAPAMNTNMWTHPAVRANVGTLAGRGVRFVDPGDGYLACGWVGPGRLAEPELIADAVERLLAGEPQTLDGVRVLVTAGPTLEDIDAVRFIGNRSSGRMGFAVARQAAARGARVTVVAGPTAVAPPPGVDVVQVRSAREMHRVVLDRAGDADLIVMAAAVADYAPAAGAAAGKIEKGGPLSLVLERTPDILADLGRWRAGRARPVLVGFAAQAGDPREAARRKLADKQVDLIVANDVTAPGAGFDVDTNIVTFVAADDEESLPQLSKDDVARRLLDRVQRLLARTPASPAVP